MVYLCGGGLSSIDASMHRRSSLAWLVAAVAAVVVPPPAAAQNDPPLAGVWTLNRSLSEMPPEIGFDVNWFPAPSGGGQTAGTPGGRGRRGSSGGRSRGGGGALSASRRGDRGGGP